ncbi:MAG: cytochrome c oxidase accessory protein CcoG, partial [Planctomycetota bacterium]
PSKRRPDLDSLYCINADGSRNTIHPADVRGRFQRRKKLVWAVLVAIYVVLPFLHIGGHPAVQIDLPNRTFYLFGSVFDSQDFYLAFFFVFGIGLTLILLSALWGRVWCGYACPHTVFLEGFFRRIERWIDGPSGQREKLAKGAWTGRKLAKRVLKHGTYLVLSLALAHVFLAYFIPVDELVGVVQHSPAEHLTAFVFTMVFTAIIYFDFAWFREQLCLIICPYGRLQSILSDPDTVNVQYDFVRGEPRGRYHVEGRGDCIDCQRCIAVCPTGIDIRNGVQMECVGCANCIDACDEVMDKVGSARGLIRYESLRGVEQGRRRFWRTRVVFYAVVFAVALVGFTVLAGGRTAFDARLVRSDGPPYVVVGAGADAQVRNIFRLHLVNKLGADATFRITPPVPWTASGSSCRRRRSR